MILAALALFVARQCAEARARMPRRAAGALALTIVVLSSGHAQARTSRAASNRPHASYAASHTTRSYAGSHARASYAPSHARRTYAASHAPTKTYAASHTSHKH